MTILGQNELNAKCVHTLVEISDDSDILQLADGTSNKLGFIAL